jgi:tRNA threonylcarbamoyladenosine biosynthesis protein TsaB
MIRLLAIESSTTMCSVAFFEGETLKALREINDGYRHAALLTRYIGEVLQEGGVEAHDLHGVVVSQGPGSYTGLRIGISAAKGVCFAANIPLIGVTAIEAMAMHLSGQYTGNELIMPMVDAGRMEVYSATYNLTMEVVEPLAPRIISPESLRDAGLTAPVVLAGNGAAKYRETFAGDDNVVFRDDVLPSATLLGAPAYNAFRHRQFADLAYFEPLYMKEFLPGKPRVKGLN